MKEWMKTLFTYLTGRVLLFPFNLALLLDSVFLKCHLFLLTGGLPIPAHIKYTHRRLLPGSLVHTPSFTNLFLLIPDRACFSSTSISIFWNIILPLPSPFHMPHFLLKVICLLFPLHSFLVLSKFNSNALNTRKPSRLRTLIYPSPISSRKIGPSVGMRNFV